MQVKIKKLHKDSVIPKYAKNGDAGMDLTAVSKHYDEHGNTVYGTGLAFKIPEGYFGLLVPRSSNAKTDLRLTNSSGILDSGYRGEVMFKYRNDNYSSSSMLFKNDLINGNIGFNNEYKIGDRIGQLIILPYPQIEFQEEDDLGETERGTGGYGSTGN
jgi:dUTP pyrophosphatase